MTRSVIHVCSQHTSYTTYSPTFHTLEDHIDMWQYRTNIRLEILHAVHSNVNVQKASPAMHVTNAVSLQLYNLLILISIRMFMC